MQTEIRAIFYDADGVLNNAFMAFSELLAAKYDLPIEKTADFYKGPFVECLEGTKDMREVLPQYLQKWGWKGTLDDFINLWFESEHSIEDEVIRDVDRLRKNGVRCYVTTNQEMHRASYMLEEMGFKHHFNEVVASSHIGVCKPSHEFFKKLLKKYELEPHDVLFWDDMEENVEAAQACGLHAELFTNVKQYKEIMKQKYRL